MSMAEKIRDKANQKKTNRSKKDEMADLFNEVSHELILDFLKDAKAGRVRVSDTTDMMRLYQIWESINDIESGSGEGQLPTISRAQSDLLANEIGVESEIVDGEEVGIIDLDSLSEKDEKEIDTLLNKREIEKNNENENFGMGDNIFG